MDELSHDEIQAILDRDVPGTRLVNGPPPFPTDPPDTDTPDLDALLEREAEPEDEGDPCDATGSEKEAPPGKDDGIVTVEPDPPNRWGRGHGPKSVVLSNGRVVGFQG
jgi:hypothetical protein